MVPNFTQLNVYWSTNSEENAKALEEVLPQVGHSLRHELSQLKVMGAVPRIFFVRDKQLQLASQVDYLLGIADYGEDHVPLKQDSEFKKGPGVEETVVIGKHESVEDGKNADENIMENNVQEDVSPHETMPKMRHDIFNLNHELIMNKISKSVKKARAVHRYQPNLAIDCKGADTLSSSSYEKNMSKEERKAAMAKFILARKILKEKQSKNKYDSDINVKLSEINEDEDYDFEYEDFKSDDYIVEDYIEEDLKHKQ